MKRFLLILLALLLCLSFASCGEDETSGDVSNAIAAPEKSLGDNIITFTNMSYVLGGDYYTANYFKEWKSKPINELTVIKGDPGTDFWRIISSYHFSSLKTAKTKDEKEMIFCLEEFVAIPYYDFPCEHIGVFDEERLYMVFKVDEEGQVKYYYLEYWLLRDFWHPEFDDKVDVWFSYIYEVFSSVNEVENHISERRDYWEHYSEYSEISENMDWSTGPY